MKRVIGKYRGIYEGQFVYGALVVCKNKSGETFYQISYAEYGQF